MSAWIEVAGWLGSVLLVVSLLQGRMMRLRVLNLIAALALVGYNVAVETWPMVGMNAAVAVIDVFFIVKLRQQSRAAGSTDAGRGHGHGETYAVDIGGREPAVAVTTVR
ncbi:YgjV family protein [Microbacterium hominis]|uniref:YgjV family protein n=1 Tax=Microbacterium hominis TaxID=162426 RepID=A0A7D4Q0L4_9MICO|nr:YgjV family protein [Microbacterium hominis]QKJ18251.1 YgjV family protein [Microbacterium hominis]